MAKGRFVSRSISTNEQLAGVSLAADYLFQRCIPHLDVDGRMTGNPMLIKATVFPLRPEITVESIPDLLSELAVSLDHNGAPLVVWYVPEPPASNSGVPPDLSRVYAKAVLEFPGFSQHQKLNPKREAASKFGARNALSQLLNYSRPTPELVPSNSDDLRAASLSLSLSSSLSLRKANTARDESPSDAPAVAAAAEPAENSETREQPAPDEQVPSREQKAPESPTRLAHIAEYAKALRQAAVAGIDYRWPTSIERPNLSSAMNLAADLFDQGIPVEFATTVITSTCHASRRPDPMSTVEWFRGCVVDAVAAAQRRPGGTTNGDSAPLQAPTRPRDMTPGERIMAETDAAFAEYDALTNVDGGGTP